MPNKLPKSLISFLFHLDLYYCYWPCGMKPERWPRALVSCLTERFQCVFMCVACSGGAFNYLLFPSPISSQSPRGMLLQHPETQAWLTMPLLRDPGDSSLQNENGRNCEEGGAVCVLKLPRMTIIKTVFVYVLTRRLEIRERGRV